VVGQGACQKPMAMFSLLRTPIEQAVYGSFPFWRRGYDVLAASAGCRREWLAALRAASQRLGEPPAGAIEAASLFALKIRRGPWMIAGVFPQGCDDEDRPGALAFHALFVGHWAYRRAGANPFAFASALKGHWSPNDEGRVLPTIFNSKTFSEPLAEDDPRSERIAAALRGRRRVVIQSAEPVDELALGVWARLPRRIRCKTSLATWAFDNANQFDFVALPKLAGLEPDQAELVLALEPGPSALHH
jgi:hypothetical protein